MAATLSAGLVVSAAQYTEKTASQPQSAPVIYENTLDREDDLKEEKLKKDIAKRLKKLLKQHLLNLLIV